jgi:integrase
MGKRANGEGSVYRDKTKDRWVGEVTINGKRIKRTAKTQREARALRDQLLKDAARLAAKDKELRSVSDLLNAWIDSQTASDAKAASTLDATQWAVDHLHRHLGSVRLLKLTFREIETAFKSMAGSKHNLSRSSLIKIRSVLNQACKWGQRRGALSDNPVAIAELPKTKTTRARRSMTLDEVQNLRETLSGNRLEALWLIFLGLGLRSGEARALLWKDWDRTKGSLAVRRSIREIDGTNEVSDEMKTPAARRNLRLPDSISERLEAHFERASLEGRDNAEDLIFCTNSGRPLDSANLRRDLKQLCMEAGIPELSVHELRHTCASLLADVGVPAENIADVLGHRDIRTTLGTYRHAISPSVGGHVDSMNSILSA